MWDSLEPALVQQYGSNPAKESSARKLATALQMAVLSGAGQGDSQAAQAAVGQASNCLFQTFGEEEAYLAADLLEGLVTDTEDRARAYLKFNFFQPGHVTSYDPAANYCL